MALRIVMLALVAAHPAPPTRPSALPADTTERVVLSPTRYELDVRVDYASETLRGTARIALTNPAEAPVRQVSLLLYRLMRVEAARDDQGSDLPFTQEAVTFEDFGALQVNQIVVTLKEPLAAGAHTAIRLDYGGYLLGYAETGMRYIQDRIDPAFTILRPDAYAYPQPGYPSIAVLRAAPPWSFTYDTRVTVPSGLTVANGGRLEGTTEQDSTITYRYASLKPSWRMDFAIAKYSLLTARGIRVFHLPGDADGAAGVAQAADTAFSLFNTWFGPLRDGAAFTLIEVPDGWGSQTDVTSIIQSAAAFRDPERHREVYHEISHFWNVPSTDRPSPRWEEGLASFLEYLVAQNLGGGPVVDARGQQLMDWLRDQLPGHPRWKQVPLVAYGRENLTDLSYSTGALFFDLLHRLVGRDAFNGIFRRYIADFGRSGGSTDDFVSVARRTVRTDLSDLVADWIYTTAWADRLGQHRTIDELARSYDRSERK